MIIKPSTTLRNNYSAISTMAHTVQEPIYITKNGEGDLVVMSIDAFEKREELTRLKAKLAAAETSRLTGASYTLAQARDKVEELYRG
jgi:prevent-host-death family protein